jgi:hypothetical protein
MSSRISRMPVHRYVVQNLGRRLCTRPLASALAQLNTQPSVLTKERQISPLHSPSVRHLSLLLNKREGHRSASEAPFYAR